MNEAFNQICTWFAPKNKVFAGTGSLPNRIAMAVGINSLGVEAFFKRLFKMLGIPLTDNVAYYLKTRETNRNKRLLGLRTRAAKQKKNKRKYDRLKEATLQAKKEYHKRQGTYRKGMNLDDPFGELTDKKQPAAKRANKGSLFCEYCGGSDHLTKRSKKCTATVDSVKRFAKETGLLLTAAVPMEQLDLEWDQALSQDCDRMDSLPFDAEYDSGNDNLLLGAGDIDVGIDDIVVVGGTI